MILDSLDDIKHLVSEEFDAVNTLISAHLVQELPLITQLCHHLMNSGGKRLRPLIVLLSARACSYTDKYSMAMAAAAIEYFHTATLLHDDVVDESALRRGHKTANDLWGNKVSILVGDYLYTQSVKWISAFRNWHIIDLFADMLHHISRGEIKQLNLQHHTDIQVMDYFDVIHSKTALLFSTSTELGGHLSGSSPEILAGLRDYGLHLGNAFQMVDDALDYCSSSDIIGKNIGDDLSNGKMTLPLFCAIERGTPEDIDLIKKSILSGTLEHLPALLDILQRTHAIDRTYEMARQEAEQAIVALDVLTDSPYKQGLLALARFSVKRTY